VWSGDVTQSGVVVALDPTRFDVRLMQAELRRCSTVPSPDSDDLQKKVVGTHVAPCGEVRLNMGERLELRVDSAAQGWSSRRTGVLG
jgi:hypothetical protein